MKYCWPPERTTPDTGTVTKEQQLGKDEFVDRVQNAPMT